MADISGANPEVLEHDSIGSRRVIDHQDRRRDSAIRVKRVKDLPREHGSMDNAINRCIAAEGYKYHSDATLPLLRNEAVLTGPTTATVLMRYRRWPNEPDPNFVDAFTAAQWRPGSMSLRWIQSAADLDNMQTIGAVEGGIAGVMSYPNGPVIGTQDETNPRDMPSYWLWPVEVSRIFVPFRIETPENPIQQIAALRGYTNDEQIELDGVTVEAGQLRFDTFILDTSVVNGVKIRTGTYQYTFSTVGFVEQYPLWKPDDPENDPDGPGRWIASTGSPYPSADITSLPGLT